MSRPRRSPQAARQPHGLDDRLEAIALRIHQVASTLGLLAEGRDEPNLSHTLYFIEQCLLAEEARLRALYDAQPAPEEWPSVAPRPAEGHRRTRRAPRP